MSLITCLFDLSDEIFLLICRYLSPTHILYSFYTPEKPEMRLHRVIFDYYTKMKFDQIANYEYEYLTSLFYSSNFPIQLQSLILSNEHVTFLIEHYFRYIHTNTIESMFNSLKILKLIDCSSEDLADLLTYYENISQLQYLHIKIQKSDENRSMFITENDFIDTSNGCILQLLFETRMPSIHTVFIELNDGLILSKSLSPHTNLRNINLILQTIDDLYILLDGLIPNVEIMIIQLCQPRILSCVRPKSTSLCLRLIEFTLLEPRIGLVIDDIKSIFSFMPNLIKLTLSIRDTPDPIFCHGPKFELILNEYFPYLHQFSYTMTHRIGNKTIIEDFIRWSMNITYYENENSLWIHIYSLPWPLNRNDKRQLPIIKNGSNLSVISDVKRSEYMKHVMITKDEDFLQLNTKFCRVSQITTCLLINIQLPLRISKLILSENTPISSMNSIIQPSINYLIVKRCLDNENDILIYARQFPNVKYLKFLFPLNKSLYIRCLKTMFMRNDNNVNIYILPQLINFSTEFNFTYFESIQNDQQLYDWLIQNTDLKYHSFPFDVHCSFSTISIWF